ncbi:hypothetical protein [Rhizobium sp. RCC_161_2]|uniref:hypothetical protein n=1 Tax=Rhizobium sp. RCC_161_2 TaxID=3239219 RepID=UPI0035255DAA
MDITRRQFAALVCALAVPLPRGAWADEGNALFWDATRADRSITIFGYERINAQIVPDIVSDGDRISDEASSVYTDFSPNVALQTLSVDRKQLSPVLPELSSTDADDLRRMITAVGGPPLERLSGFEVSLFLMGEGQHRPVPSVGGVITDHVRSGGKQLSPLISDAELRSIWHPLDTAAVKSVGAHQVSYLLEKRKQLGPIGGYLETLYQQRRAPEIMTLTAEIAQKGVVDPLRSLGGEQIKSLLLAQILKIDSVKNFILLPLGTLAGDDGILQMMRSNGFEIRSLA